MEIADSTLPDGTKPTAPTLEQFLSGLRTAWKEGEVRPTARPHSKAIRLRRRPDPFASVDGQLREWFATEPWRTSRELLERLQSERNVSTTMIQPGSEFKLGSWRLVNDLDWLPASARRVLLREVETPQIEATR